MRGVVPIFWAAGSLIIMGFIIILIGILLMRVFSWTKDTVVYFFGGFFSPPTPLEKALICYYHICANTGVGCRHPNVDKWCRDVEIYPLINYEEICSLPSALKVDGEQCRKAYFQFPLRISLNEPQEVRVKTLRDKRNIDSGKEYVFLLTPLPSVIYGGSKFVYFAISESVKLVNSVVEEKPPYPYECPKGSACLESATVNEPSYEIVGVIYKGGQIYVPMSKKGYYSIFPSFSQSGQSREVRIDLWGEKDDSLKERYIRISVDAEKNENDDMINYNYILGVKAYFSCILDIGIWGGNDPISYESCKFGPTAPAYIEKDCKKDFVKYFVTRGGGLITIKVKEINFRTDAVGYCYVDYLTLNITYEKRNVKPS
jgi:hypothetical protein